MKQILREQDMPLTGEFRPSAVLGAISRAKNEMLDPTFLAENAVNHRERTIARLATRYQERLRGAGALDFDDLLLEAAAPVRRGARRAGRLPGALALPACRRVPGHEPGAVPVDQGPRRALRQPRASSATTTSRSTAGAARTCATSSTSSATGRRRAVVKLERNYRSTQLILDAAHAVVSRNTARKDKKLWTEIAGGAKIQRFEAYNEDEEAEWIARQVEGLVGGRGSALTRRADDDESDTRFRARDIAILYRMNAQSRAIEELFLRYGIRYQLIGGTRFYSRREVKDALAYLRILRSDTDSVSFERIINVPARSIGEKTIEALRAVAAAPDPETGEPTTTWAAIERAVRGEVPTLAPRARTALADFAALVRRLRTRVGVLPLPELLDEALELSGYRAMLADGSEDGEERWANLLELRSVTTRYDDLDPEDALDRLLEETALVADQDSYEGDADAVTLITLHAAKGLEFPVVFIAGLEEGLFPHSRALDDERQLEEERRLAYVGITRAKRRLFLSHAWRRATWGMGQAAGAVPVPARDPGRAHGRTAAGRPRRTGGGPRPRPRVRVAPDDALQHARPGGKARPTARAAADPAHPPKAKRSGRRATSPPSGRRSRRAPRPGVSACGTDGAGATAPASAPSRPIIPGERQFRDGDRVRHGRWGDGIVVTSKLTRSDEEITVAFKDAAVGRKTMLASLANLDIVG